MSKPCQLRLTEIRSVFRLVGDCRDLGRDVWAWNWHLSKACNQLFGCVMTNSFLWTPDPQAILAAPVLLSDHWIEPELQQHWYRFVHEQKYRQMPTITAFAREYGKVTSARREELMASTDWELSHERNVARGVCRQDEFVYLTIPLVQSPGRQMGMSYNRATNERPLNGREQAQINLLGEELQALLGKRLLYNTGQLWDGLRTRLQQVLLALHTGDTEKQISLKMGLSRHTVHDYVCELYQHFGVSSRAELLSVCRIVTPPKEMS